MEQGFSYLVRQLKTMQQKNNSNDKVTFIIELRNWENESGWGWKGRKYRRAKGWGGGRIERKEERKQREEGGKEILRPKALGAGPGKSPFKKMFEKYKTSANTGQI